MAPESPIVRDWKTLLRAFVSRGVKTPSKYSDFINMTWSNCVKCKDALLRAWGAASFTGEGEGAIKSSGTLSLPGLGWQLVNHGSQSGFISYV